MKPRLDHLKESIDHLSDNIEENRANNEEESSARIAKHNHYMKNKKEFENAIMILEECIELVYNLKD